MDVTWHIVVYWHETYSKKFGTKGPYNLLSVREISFTRVDKWWYIMLQLLRICADPSAYAVDHAPDSATW
jgi:hypothetical protein